MPGSRARYLASLLLVALAVAIGGCKRESGLPVLGHIGEFQLKDQTGKPVGPAQLRGKVWVAAFMFTRCPTVCPRITQLMQEVQSSAKKQNVPLHFVSFSVDPEHDTPEVLSQYAQKYRIDTRNWQLLTGDLETVKKTSIDSFKLALEGKPTEGAEHMGIVHGSHLVLVDSKLDIRGFYSSNELGAGERLVSDAKGLSPN